jgi:hypothetical protein
MGIQLPEKISPRLHVCPRHPPSAKQRAISDSEQSERTNAKSEIGSQRIRNVYLGRVYLRVKQSKLHLVFLAPARAIRNCILIDRDDNCGFSAELGLGTEEGRA